MKIENKNKAVWNGKLDIDSICGFGSDLCILNRSNQDYSSYTKLS